MVPRRWRENGGPLVVKTVTKIPSSNATVAQKGANQKMAVIKLRDRKPMPARSASSSYSGSSGDKKDFFLAKEKNAKTKTGKKELSAPRHEVTKPKAFPAAKENDKKVLGKRNLLGMIRSSSNPAQRPRRFQVLSNVVGFRRASSEVVTEVGPRDIPKTISWVTDDGSESNRTPEKHVAFTREAIQTDMLNKARRRHNQQQSCMDPYSLLNRFFCNALPFSSSYSDVVSGSTQRT